MMCAREWSPDASRHAGRSTPFTNVALRVLAGGITAAVILTIFGQAVSAGPATSVPLWQNLGIKISSGVLYVAVLTPLAMELPYRRLVRFVALFVPLYVTGTLADLVEGYFFTTTLTPFTLVAALVIGAIPSLAIAGVVAWFIPALPKDIFSPDLPMGQRRPWISWVWRILLAGILYVPIYFLFTRLVTPIEQPFYNDPAFVAQLHTRVQPDSVIVTLEAFRGALFAIALVPALLAMRHSRARMVLYLALIGAVVEAWVPLLGLTAWPLPMRLGNLLELTGDALGRGIVIVWLLALPGKDTTPSVNPNRFVGWLTGWRQ